MKPILIQIFIMLNIRFRKALSRPFKIADIFPAIYINGHIIHILVSSSPAVSLLKAKTQAHLPKNVYTIQVATPRVKQNITE